jgi:hypothetical protein
VEEVETLLSRFYGGETPPPFEVTAFVRFFDRKKRGKIGWTDFKDGFGLAQAASNGGESGNIDGAAATGAGAELKALMSGKGSLDTKRLFELAAGLDDDSSGSNGSTADSSRLLGSGDKPTTSPSRDDNVEDGKESAPDGTTAEESSQDESGGGAEGGAADVKLSVEGTISVELEGGAKVEVDAAQYLDGLKVEKSYWNAGFCHVIRLASCAPCFARSCHGRCPSFLDFLIDVCPFNNSCVVRVTIRSGRSRGIARSAAAGRCSRTQRARLGRESRCLRRRCSCQRQ